MSDKKALTVKSLFNNSEVKDKFNELMGKRSSAFITSVLQIVSQNGLLAKADPVSVYQSAAMAATLNLPLNNNLGFAYIVPYNVKQADGSKKVVAQFQMGYKGYIQLAMRTGQFQTISATPIYENQLIEQNPLTGFKFDFSVEEKGKLIGFASYFKLINGFEKTFYMTTDELKSHGVKYSKSYNTRSSMWKNEFEAMAQKTVLKLLLSKYAPLSVEMEKSVLADQSVVKDYENGDYQYVDNDSGKKGINDSLNSMLDGIEYAEDVTDSERSEEESSKGSKKDQKEQQEEKPISQSDTKKQSDSSQTEIPMD